MMDFIKRHAFLLGLAAGVVVLAAAMLVVTYLSYARVNTQLENQLRQADSSATGLLNAPLYNTKVVEELKKQADLRKMRYEDLLQLIAKMGHDRQPLVKEVFPLPKDASVLHSFKAEYDVALEGFMKKLGAMDPSLPADATAAQVKVRETALEHAMMFAHPKISFFRPDWVDKAEAPGIDLVRFGQENVWLMSDIVDIIAKLNDEILVDPKQPRGIKNAVVKELIEIQIGAERAFLEGMSAPTGMTRYLMPSPNTPPGTREATATGRVSNRGFYLVLPFRLSVVADASRFGELVRRLKDTESFLAVGAVSVDPLTEGSFSKNRGLLAPEMADYGNAGVVRLTLVAESLLFQLPDGRVTTPPEVLKAMQPAPAKTPPAGETKPGPAAPPKKQ